MADGEAVPAAPPLAQGDAMIAEAGEQRKKSGFFAARKTDVRAKEKTIARETKQKMKKYRRDSENEARFITEPDQPMRLKASLRRSKNMREQALKSAAKAELIHNTETSGYLELDEGEQGRDIRQRDILEHADLQTTRKRFDLTLNKLGPYMHSYSQNGNMLALAGEKGHLAVFKWKEFKSFAEVQLRDRIYDVQFLNDDQLLATAQRKYVYVYNNKGQEVHLLKNLQNIRAIDFLPKHMLLTAIGTQGVLHYFDVSLGQAVAVQKTKMGPCNVMRQNPWNAVMALGHTTGVVSMWSPTASAPLVKVLAHQAPLVDVCFTLDGKQMVTCAADSTVKVWDARTWKMLHTIHQKTAPTGLDISQTGLLSVAAGHKLEVWKDWAKAKPHTPYLTHQNKNNADAVTRLRFCPYEDTLGMSHASGFTSILVPGSGEPNYDYYVANPYETQQQRKERPVHQLLDKLPPEMIVLNPREIGTVDKGKAAKGKEKQALQAHQTRQQDHVKKAQGEGVQEDDIESDAVEATIVRPDALKEEKKQGARKIRKPKHLKEKKSYLAKQERQRFLVRQETRKRALDGSGNAPDGQTAGEGEGEVAVAHPQQQLQPPAATGADAAAEPKKKRRRKAAPTPSDPLHAFFEKAEAEKRRSK